MGRFDTVVFDMDGTLLNTLDDLTDSVNYVMKLHGLPERTLKEVRSFVGNGVTILMELCIPGGQENPEFDACLEEFLGHYKNNMQNKTAPYAGITELLKKLRERGYKLAVVSNKFDRAVKLMSRMYFGEMIQVAIGESKNMRKKPAPDSVIKALEELGASAEKAVYVGDSDIDVRTAKNAGLVCVGVTWGFRDRALLKKEGADYLIDRPDELLGILE